MEHRPLVMRANRVMGSALAEHNFVKFEDLEAANERMLELAAEGDFRQASVLAILANEKHALKEGDVLKMTMEEYGIGLVDVRHYEVPDEVKKALDLNMCWATWSVPFDREDGIWLVATAYYLSNAVRSHWEKTLGGTILWYGCTIESVADFLDALQVERAQAEAKAAQGGAT